MAKAVNRLTARFVTTCTKPGRHADGDGLYLSVTPDGKRKRWTLLYKRNGRQREMGLGSASDTSLADARKAADAARALLRDGIDPLEAKRKAEAESNAPTFGVAADTFIAAHEPSWRNEKHVAQWKMTLSRARDDDGNLLKTGYCLPLIGKRVDEVTTEDVLTILQPIWNVKPETANRVRGRIEQVLDAAKVQGHRTGENPARWRGHLQLLLPKRTKLSRGHHAAMPYRDVPAFVQRLHAMRGVGAWCLEFVILTAARSGEARGATWSEIDLQAQTWTIPAERMKAGVEHVVPLPDRAVEILETVALLRREADKSGIVFPGLKLGKPLSDMGLANVLRRLEVDDVATVHGFRSSFRDWVGDETSFPRELAEQALAHAVGDDTELAYRRGTALAKRRKVMEAWERYLLDTKPANVVTIRRAK